MFLSWSADSAMSRGYVDWESTCCKAMCNVPSSVSVTERDNEHKCIISCVHHFVFYLYLCFNLENLII